MWGNVRIVTTALVERDGLHPFTVPAWPVAHESPYCIDCGVHKDGHTGRPMGQTEAQQAANRRNHEGRGSTARRGVGEAAQA